MLWYLEITRGGFDPLKADEPKVLRVRRAAHELGLHPFTVRKWIKAGKIQAIRVGNEARVPRTEIERLAGKNHGRLVGLCGGGGGGGGKSDPLKEHRRVHTRAGESSTGESSPVHLGDWVW